VLFEGSDFDANAFYVSVFFMPFFVPAEQLVLNFGRRLGNRSCRWNKNDPDIDIELSDVLKNEALPYLSEVETPEQVADWIAKHLLCAPRAPETWSSQKVSSIGSAPEPLVRGPILGEWQEILPAQLS
jgi:hypothetical protein